MSDCKNCPPHEYHPLNGKRYAKPIEGSFNSFTDGPSYDHSQYFSKLYCRKCGETIEVEAS